MRGVDILILINTSSTETPTYTVVGGQRNATFSETSETIDVTSKDSNGNYEYDYGLYGWSISCDGLYIADEVAWNKLKAAMRNKEKVVVRVTENGAATEQGEALVTSRDVEAPYNAEATYSIELQGTGALSAAE